MLFYGLLGFLMTVAVVAKSVNKKIPFEEGRAIELMMPMRDGIELHTRIVFPRAKDGQTKFPVVIDRSPYGYTGLEWIANIFVPFGYVAVGQDMRGTEKSQGNFTMWQSDAEDSRDAGDWIVSQEWSDGQIMTFGASADGIGSLQTPKTNPSWLTAQYITWASAQLYQSLFPYGAYKQETVEDWLMGLTMPNPAVVYDNIKTVYENEAHTPFWDKVELSAQDYANIKARSAFWGGWYDLFLLGTLQAFDGYNTLSDPSVRGTSVITIDPLGHCLDFDDFFTENAVMGRTALVLAQAYEVFGARPVKRDRVKAVTFYVMSSNDDAGKEAGQFWVSVDKFPTPVMTDFFLHADKTASVKPPTSGATSSSFKYDPTNPVPTMGGNNLPDSIGGSIPCGPMNQVEVDKRADVLTFQTDVFDKPLYLTGPLMSTLYVSSDAIDTDFTVKISDVYPTGEVLLIQDNAIRMRWREGGVKPVYMKKDEVYKVEMNLWNTSYAVAPGHALRFSISSSNYPRFSVNPNNGLLLNDPNYPGQNITAVNTLFHSTRYPSKISLPVVTRLQLPEIHVLKAVEESYPHMTEDFVRKNVDGVNKIVRRK